jgi:cytochrome c5
MAEEHSSLIKTPRQLITVVVLAFAVPVTLIVLLTIFVAGNKTGGVGSDALTPEAVAERLRPVGTVAFAGAQGPRALQAGEAVYKTSCSSCHTPGIAGAPRTGDTAGWAPRLRKGFDTLVKHAVEGFNAMPPKGGNPALDPVEVARAVAYMANQSGGKFKEPAAPAAVAAATPARTPASPVTGPAAAAAAAGASPPPVALAPPATGGAPKAAAAVVGATGGGPDGAKVYGSGCQVCHTPGIAGAPKFGDKASWGARVQLGLGPLTESVIKGKGAMPPRGGVPNASDAELSAAVEYMLAHLR